MFYSEAQARELVLRAGLELIEEKLIARTWGNISARISETEFIITPSGRAYETLTSDDLVKVNIETLAYTGKYKPSSEKGIHAACYKLRKDVAFIIHTHQIYASAISISGQDQDFAPCAGYGLPGTKGLCRKVTKCIVENPESGKFLLTRHGALCLGKDYEDAFRLAKELEEESRNLFEICKSDVSRHKRIKAYLDDYAQIMGLSNKPLKNEDKDAIELICKKNELAACFGKHAKPMNCFDVMLQNFVYRKKYSKLKDEK